MAIIDNEMVLRQEVPFGELLLYNLRHLQEHGAYFSMFLGQKRRNR